MPQSNPFATRFTRPGAIDYLFEEAQSLDSLVARLRDNAWWGEIVGPHGSGKSTLLAALTPALEDAGRRVMRLAVSPARPQGSGFRVQDSPPGTAPVAVVLPAEAYRAAASGVPDASLQLVIDGYEQLSWFTRRRIQALSRRRGAGLLVTVHQPIGLPPLFETRASPELAERIVARILPAGDTTIRAADVAQAYEQSQGNLRETLFALYDIYQARRARA